VQAVLERAETRIAWTAMPVSVRLPEAHDDDLLRLWDAPVRTPGLRWGG